MGDPKMAVAPVTVVLAVYKPTPEHLIEQIRSLCAQTYPISKLVAVIADRSSVTLVRDAIADAPWDVDYLVPEAETSSYKSFELGLKRAVELSPNNALFSFCDQDDHWHPTKLEKSVAVLESSGASLVHTDARLVEEGIVQSTSLFRYEKRARQDSPRALLIRNSVTGMTTLFTRETALASVPFPAQSALFFHHDLWLALVASVMQGIARVAESLVDYRQHSVNVVGAVGGKRRLPRIFSRAWMRHWVGSYSVAVYLAKSLYLRMQEVNAAGTGRADDARLACLSPYLAPRALGGKLIGDSVKWALRGRRAHALQSAMFGCVQLARMAWSLCTCLKSGTLQALAAFDTKAFAQAPGAQPGNIAPPECQTAEVWDAKSFREERCVRRFDIRVAKGVEPQTIVLVPSLNPAEIFAGIATAIDIGLGLTSLGHRVVFVATDLPIASRVRTETFIANRGRAIGAEKPVDFEVFCGTTENELILSSEDRIVATAWWSAHIAETIMRDAGLRHQQFFYLIQDYEPGFYAWGAEYAGALASYSLDYVPIFNTTTLRDYFGSLGFSRGLGPELSFHPAIDIPRYAGLRRTPNKVRRLVVYGRPEVARNLFPIAVEATEKFLNQSQISPSEIEILSVGLKHPDVRLSQVHQIRSLGKIPWDDYPNFLSSIDIGLSLMLSPHPSHPPIEMAVAGARVVTNGFSNKDLRNLSGGILSVEPTVTDVSGALAEAWRLGSPSQQSRNIDLRCLGRPMSEMVDDLSAFIGTEGLAFAKAS